ncbi:MAG: hypothetical protein FWG52_09425 [Proteobacteria bacterium]|nr:hypothetical protein [Pseudomonadota bacterium]
MGWILIPFSKDELVFRLCCREMTDSFLRETVAYVDTPGTLWRVVKTTARQDGVFGLKAGESRRTIACDLIRRNPDTGELSHCPVPESESPKDLSCPLHFFDMAPVAASPSWRKAVRRFHAEQKRALKAFLKTAATAAVSATQHPAETFC